jgi:hypothetical protein
MKKITVILLLLLLILQSSYTYAYTVNYEQSPTVVNPFRGYATYRPDNGDAALQFPCSLEYSYFSMKDLMPSENTFDFSSIQQFKQDANSRGRHIVFRVYVDYPDNPPSGVPDWLTTGNNAVVFKDYTDYGGGKSPDYTNTRLIAAMKSLIVEMGKTFDGDAGIAYIQVGLLGFWGEFHTYPHDDWFPAISIQNDILSTYAKAFNTTSICVSADQLQYYESSSETILTGTKIGWHDDNFAVGTYDAKNLDWNFWPRVVARGMQDRWKVAVIGGEIQPDIQKQIFDKTKSCSDCQNFALAATTVHASWLLFYDIYDPAAGLLSKPAVVAAAKEGSKLLGYQYYLKSVSLTECATASDSCFDLTISLQNIGSAPFYYPLQLKAQLNSNAAFVVADQLQTLLPSNTATQYQIKNIQIPNNQQSQASHTLTFTLSSSFILANQDMAFANSVTNSNGNVQTVFSVPLSNSTDTDSSTILDDSIMTSDTSVLSHSLSFLICIVLIIKYLL